MDGHPNSIVFVDSNHLAWQGNVYFSGNVGHSLSRLRAYQKRAADFAGTFWGGMGNASLWVWMAGVLCGIFHRPLCDTRQRNPVASGFDFAMCRNADSLCLDDCQWVFGANVLMAERLVSM